MGCQSSKNEFPRALAELGFKPTGIIEIDELYKSSSQIIYLAETFRQAVLSFRANGFHPPAISDRDRLETYLDIIRESPQKLSMFLAELQQLKSKSAAYIQNNDDKKRVTKKGKEKAIKHNIKKLQEREKSIIQVQKIAEEAAKNMQYLDSMEAY